MYALDTARTAQAANTVIVAVTMKASIMVPTKVHISPHCEPAAAAAAAATTQLHLSLIN
jgi:hypothetical protein